MITTKSSNKYKYDDADKRVSNFIRNSVPKEIMQQATKSHLNFEKIFMRLIFGREDTWFQREGTNALVRGVVGNVCANRYLASQEYQVKNEVPIYDIQHKKVSASDIVLTSHRPFRQTFLELKTTKAIILNEKDYPFEQDYSFGFGEYIPSELMVFDHERSLPQLAVNSGQKALQQLKKTRDHIALYERNGTSEAKLCVFKGTFLSDEFLRELYNYNGLITIPIDVERIFDYSSLLVEKIMTEGREMIQPTKGREPKIIEMPDLEL